MSIGGMHAGMTRNGLPVHACQIVLGAVQATSPNELCFSVCVGGRVQSTREQMGACMPESAGDASTVCRFTKANTCLRTYRASIEPLLHISNAPASTRHCQGCRGVTRDSAAVPELLCLRTHSMACTS
eukprot:2262243-Pleurochrysis_carterae.AAC.1